MPGPSGQQAVGDTLRRLRSAPPGSLGLPCEGRRIAADGQESASAPSIANGLRSRESITLDAPRFDSVIGMEEGRESEPLPYAVEHIEGIARRLHEVLTELQEANRANYPPGAWEPGPLQWKFMEAIDGLLDSELLFIRTLQEIKTEQRRRLGRLI